MAVWAFGFLFWAGLLWILSSQSSIKTPDPFPHFDKVQHFLYFAGGGFLAAGTLFRLKPDPQRNRLRLFGAVLITALVGAIDEWHQLSTPGRIGGDLGDWLADLTGGTAGALLLSRIHPRLR